MKQKHDDETIQNLRLQVDTLELQQEGLRHATQQKMLILTEERLALHEKNAAQRNTLNAQTERLALLEKKSDLENRIANRLADFYTKSIDNNAPTVAQIASLLELTDDKLPAADLRTSLEDLFEAHPTFTDVLAQTQQVSHDRLLTKARPEALAIIAHHKPCISVVMPTWNRAISIETAIRSALTQSVEIHELIIIDDASTDNTIELLTSRFSDEIASGRIVLIPCEKGGVCRMRNIGLETATGDIIAFLDSDNYWHHDHLLWAVGGLLKSGANSAYTASNVHHLTENWSRVDCAKFDRRALLGQNFIDLNCFIHRASLLTTNSMFDVSLKRLVDWDYIIRLTRGSDPVQVPVATVEYFLDKAALGHISFQEPLEENVMKIQFKHREELISLNALSANRQREIELFKQDLAQRERANIATAKSNTALSSGAAPIVQEPENSALENRPYFGGLTLFVVLPNPVVTAPKLPISLVKARYLRVTPDVGWIEYDSEGHEILRGEALPAGNYWLPDLRQPMPSPHQLATLAAATQLTEIDLAIASYSLAEAPEISVTCLRNQLVMRHHLVARYLAAKGFAAKTIGKVLRIPQGDANNAHSIDLGISLQCEVTFGADGQYFQLGSETPMLPNMRSQPPTIPIPHAHEPNPRVLVMAQKLAVGGVERNTIEVTRALRESHCCIYLTLEKIHSAQGSLCHQAVEACSQVLDLAEIAHHAIFPALLRHINALYDPQALWICNGSMWLAAHAAEVRSIFEGCGIVDQQVYDAKAGWINRYPEPGIQSFDRFIAINRKIQATFIDELGMSPAKIDLIYSAVNAERFTNARNQNYNSATQRAAYDLPLDKTIVAFMGRLVDQKRPLDFLTIAERCQSNPDLHFVLVGDGVLRPEIEAAMKKKPLANFTWIANVADTTTFWPAIDLYVVTSEYEGLPIALIEAIALGVPVLSTDVGDIRYVVDRYEAGAVVDAIGDPAKLAKILLEMAPSLDKLAKILAPRGEEIIAFFSAKSISGQFAESFAKAAQRKVQ